jgi:hypothetical protein
MDPRRTQATFLDKDLTADPDTNRQLMATRAEVDDADTTITTTLQSLVFAERTVADAERSGDMTITGDRDTASTFLLVRSGI